MSRLIAEAAAATGVFPLGGIRVRLYPAEYYAIADGHDENAFVAIVARVGAGRDRQVLHDAAKAVFSSVSDFFSDELTSNHFMLSLDVIENNPDFSFKANTIHQRLKSEAKG